MEILLLFLQKIRDFKKSSKEYIKKKYNKKDKIFVSQSVNAGKIYEQISSINHLKIS